MPLYTYKCKNNHTTEEFHSVKLLGAYRQICGICGENMPEIVIQAPLMVKMQAECRYDSPITGAPITSHHARLEDMKRHDCVEYDPEMKTDYERRIKEGDDKLDALIDAHVEETIEKMPTAKRAQLYSEMTEQGMTADVVRSTPTA